MEEQASIKLVRLAQQGRQDCMNRLAAEAEGRLRAYIYRVTLDHDLTQDLSQEALLQMVKSLKDLKKAERFWPWLYRIAQSKIQQHFKAKRRKTAFSESPDYKDFLTHHVGDHPADGSVRLAQKELSKKVMNAMQQMQQQYRAVLSLRCLEQLSYSDIGVAMECNEVKARVLFFRARQALKKRLSQQGLNKGLLVMSLGLFGKLTTPAEAASSANFTVTAASVKVGLTAALIATASTKLGVATMTAAAVGLAGIGGVSVLSQPPLPERTEVRSVHYTTQLRNANRGPASSTSRGAYEQWYSFPDGVDGPVFMRMQRWNPQQEQRLCSWLQDEQANYYYSSDERKVYIHNYRVFWSSLKVWRLPTDTAQFTDFLSQVEGETKGMVFARDGQTGLLAGSVDNRFVDAPNFRTHYRYNATGEQQFQYDWPADVPVIDARDPMHRRGWTYFRVHGRVGDTKIEGRGQVPFVCEACDEHPAWMTLRIGDDLEIIDCNDGAYLRRGDGALIAAYKPGSFFKGLARPWMGMHAMNTVRRDAAEQRVWFNTRPASNRKDVVVTLLHDNPGGKTDLVYTIDAENDLIKDIRFDVRKRTRGSLVFSHFQGIDQLGDEYSEPVVPDQPNIPLEEGPGVLWLVSLARGDLGT
ncbi:MAG: RNA polymerase sigma factor [Planctomycetota bacterium]|jgi:RNA polymerase sigma-70 factor (ECF subfamily)